MKQLKSIDDVKEVYCIFGAYDILVRIESDDVKKIRGTIIQKIRKIEKTSSTLTLIVIED